MTKKDPLQEKIKKAEQEAKNREKTEEEEIPNIEKELEQMTETAKRAMADLQNLKRRQEEEKYAWIKMANEELISNLLSILDDFNRAKTHIPENEENNNNVKQWIEGVIMSANKFKEVLEKAGLVEIKTVGENFNPDLHEALLQGPGKKDTIIEELEKGYMLGTRIIRHAKVKVGNGEKK